MSDNTEMLHVALPGECNVQQLPPAHATGHATTYATTVAPDSTLAKRLAELNGLIARVARHHGFTDADTAEARVLAAASVEEALRCYRAIAAVIPATTLPGMPDSDERITCGLCSNLAGELCRADGRATAAKLKRRCGSFQPKRGDPDQRTGRERWPWLWDSEQ